MSGMSRLQLCIRIRIGSGFNDFVDPVPVFQSRSRGKIQIDLKCWIRDWSQYGSTTLLRILDILLLIQPNAQILDNKSTSCKQLQEWACPFQTYQRSIFLLPKKYSFRTVTLRYVLIENLVLAINMAKVPKYRGIVKVPECKYIILSYWIWSGPVTF
jgi:hypothetical protein